MKITCPSCAADYNVPGGVAAGRTVRCAKCGVEWVPVAPPAVQEPPPLPELPPVPVSQDPSGEKLERLAPPPPSPEGKVRRWPLLLAWLASFGVVAAALALAFVFRAPIMRAWPPSQRVYGLLHLRTDAITPVQGHGDAATPVQGHGEGHGAQ